MSENAPVGQRYGERLFGPEWIEQVLDGLKIQAQVIYAVILRESRTRYGKSDLGYLWAVIDPLIEMAVLVLLFSLLGRHAAVTAPLPVFIAMGILPFQFMRGSVGRGAAASSSNQALLTYPQVKVVDIVIGRTILELSTTLVVYALFMIGLAIVLGIPLSEWYDEPLEMCFALACLFIMGLGLGLFSSSLARLFPMWPSIWGYISRPLWFLSGIFFTMQSLPHGPRQYVVYNPLAHVLEMIRSASLPSFESSVYSPSFILVTAVILMSIGLALDRLMTIMGHTERTA